MNRSILLLCLFSGPFSLLAQGHKGDWLINGGLQFDHFRANDFQKSSGTYGLNAQLGYYFVKGLAAGAALEISQPFQGITNVNFMPFLRANATNKQASPFAQVSTGFGKNYFKDSNGISVSQFQLRLRAGLAFNLAKTATLDAYLNYYAINKISSEFFGDLYDEQRLSLGFGMSYYLQQDRDGTDSVSLVDTYLKSGNKSLGIEGISIEREAFFFRLFWAKQLKDRFQLSATLNSFSGSFTSDEELEFWELLSINFKQYFQLKNKTYIAASAGPDIWLFLSPQSDNDAENRLFIHAKPSLVHFFKHSILDIGINVWSPLNKDLENGQQRVSAMAVLGYEYFLTQRLSLRGEFWGALSGDNWLDNSLVFWEPVGNTHFQLGFHYFYQKQHKN